MEKVSRVLKKKGCGTEKYLKKYDLKLLKLGKINLQIQEVQQIPIKINSEKSTFTHIMIKMMKTKDKENILKSVIEKWHITHKVILV